MATNAVDQPEEANNDAKASCVDNAASAAAAAATATSTTPAAAAAAAASAAAGASEPASDLSSTAAAAAAATVDAANDDESDDDEAETVEESPCSRWLKRKEEVKYRDVPGVDTAYLAMDSEEGVEVVWNEAQFSSNKKFKAQEDKLKNVFEALTIIDHPNIVKFHKFWMDPGSVDEKTGEKSAPRVTHTILI